MEICEEVIVHRSESNDPKMVASDNFSQQELVPSSVENLRSELSLINKDKENNNIPQSTNTPAKFDSENRCNAKVIESHSAMRELKQNRQFNSLPTDINTRQDTYSIASSYSSTSSSSSISSMGITFEAEKITHPSLEQKTVKVFGPADESQGNPSDFQVHNKIRRVPSKANPKHRIPTLPRNQRSISQPHIQVNPIVNHRRYSSPSQLGHVNQNVRNERQFASSPNFVHQQPVQQPKEPQQQQQQMFYLQIQQPSENQLCDPQRLQEQISSQLQLLVPQIYNRLIHQMNTNSAQLNSEQHKSDPSTHIKDPNIDPNTYLNSNFTLEENQPQKVINQVLTQNSISKSYSNPKTQNSLGRGKRLPKQTNGHKQPSLDSLNENDHISRQLTIHDLNQIFQQISPEVLQENHSKSQPIYIEKQLPGYPKIVIPVMPELIYQVQQLQQLREPNLCAYRPRLEPIPEESLSVKHLNVSKFPKTKFVACIITVLCVVVVILLAGDKVIAVAVIAAIFILFLLASTFYLYTHSTRSEMDDSLSTTDSSKIQVNNWDYFLS